MTVRTDSAAATGTPPLIGFEAALAELCRADKYRDMASSYAQFVAAHPGTSYLAFEPIPARIYDHLVEKTHAPSAVTTLTLRKPTWVNGLRRALADPAAFETYVIGLEAEVRELAKQMHKLN